MLKIVIPGGEFFDEETNEFIYGKDQLLKLEHSLLSVSKWESKWEIPFLHDDPLNPKTNEMLMDYVRCMTLNEVPMDIYDRLPRTSLDEISKYIASKQSATTFTELPSANKKNDKQIITSELLYYYMVAAQIPMECEKWHINRLLNLIKIYSINNEAPDKKPKVSKRQSAMSRHELNKQRQQLYNTKG